MTPLRAKCEYAALLHGLWASATPGYGAVSFRTVDQPWRLVTVYGDGQQLRDFTYVDDIARGAMAALRPLGYEAINLGSDCPLVLNHVIQQIETLVERPAHLIRQPRHEADVESAWADIRKAGRLLNWKPETLFASGSERLVTWYCANREWAKDIPTA